MKNSLDHYAVLNRIAKSVIKGCGGHHPEFVFTRDGKPVAGIINSGWKAARRRAAKRYQEQLRRSCPTGFRKIRVHDLKHTYGHRLRAAGIGFEDRKILLGHKPERVHSVNHVVSGECGYQPLSLSVQWLDSSSGIGSR